MSGVPKDSPLIEANSSILSVDGCALEGCAAIKVLKFVIREALSTSQGNALGILRYVPPSRTSPREDLQDSGLY